MNWELPRRVVSLGALALALLHLIFPSLSIDFVTVVLLVIAVLPWLVPLLDALELPGGWRVEFRKLEEAAKRAEKAGLLAKSEDVKEKADYSFQVVADTDPNLALAGLRIEIEKRLVQLANLKGIGTKKQGLGRLMYELTKVNALTEEERSVLSDLVNLLNAAVHGENRNHLASLWALDVGPRLLESLDERISVAGGRTE